MDVVLNDLRKEIPPECADFIAYADDLACVVKGNTRAELNTNSERIIKILSGWCNSHKLKISATKTVAIMFKGNLDESRLTAIKIDGKSIKFVEKVKYLGIIIDKDSTFWNMPNTYERKSCSTSV